MTAHVSSTVDAREARRIHGLLLRWYRANARVLPWRDHHDPYAILVSEIMLQQTQAARVLEHLPCWLERFPDIKALARATRRDVLLAWAGMGYNRRAIALHEAAQRILHAHNGCVPSHIEDLLALPGVGVYTAHAVRCFGFRLREALVDVNVRRVFSRLFVAQRSESDMESEAWSWDTARDMLPPRAFYNWNQALMDLGALVCTARAPRCAQCPLSSACASAFQLLPSERGPRGLVRETPRRIHRGRILQLLREAPAHTLGFEELIVAVYGPRADGVQLLEDALRTLEADGLARRIATHDGSRTLRVELAE